MQSGASQSFLHGAGPVMPSESVLSNENLMISPIDNNFFTENQNESAHFVSAQPLMGLATASKMPKIINQQKNGALFKKKLAKTDPVSRYQTLQNDRKKLMQKKRALHQGASQLKPTTADPRKSAQRPGLAMAHPLQPTALSETPSMLLNTKSSGKKKLSLTNRSSQATNKTMIAVEQRAGSIFNLHLPSAQLPSAQQRVNCSVQQCSFDNQGNLVHGAWQELPNRDTSDLE